MTYEQSDWFDGLKFAEQMFKDGYLVEEFCYQEEYVMWSYEGIQAIHYGSYGWMNGVRDYYKNRRDVK